MAPPAVTPPTSAPPSSEPPTSASAVPPAIAAKVEPAEEVGEATNDAAAVDAEEAACIDAAMGLHCDWMMFGGGATSTIATITVDSPPSAFHATLGLADTTNYDDTLKP